MSLSFRITITFSPNALLDGETFHYDIIFQPNAIGVGLKIRSQRLMNHEPRCSRLFVLQCIICRKTKMDSARFERAASAFREPRR
jgi:hypothetical protein